MAEGLVTIIGGSGFLGRHIVGALARTGARIRIAVRHPEKARMLQPMGDVGQIMLVQTNIRNEDSVRAALRGADVVINLVGVLYNGGPQSFDAVHVEGAARVARLSATMGVKTLVHVSAIGADVESRSRYARTKGGGEAAVRATFPGAVIVRPSVVFGPDDSFFNRFGAMARMSPVLPVFGNSLAEAGSTRVQPVYVGDVAAAIAAIVAKPEMARGQTFELAGPQTYSWRQIMELVCEMTGRHRVILPVPYAIAGIGAAFAQQLPSPPLTRDQLILLQIDNVADPAKPGLAALGVTPTAVEGVVPAYMQRYRRMGLAPKKAERVG
jgi:uncharacterized protein YbjT (DUF2867 family)